jgi:hypothetical protein
MGAPVLPPHLVCPLPELLLAPCPWLPPHWHCHRQMPQLVVLTQPQPPLYNPSIQCLWYLPLFLCCKAKWPLGP